MSNNNHHSSVISIINNSSNSTADQSMKYTCNVRSVNNAGNETHSWVTTTQQFSYCPNAFLTA